MSKTQMGEVGYWQMAEDHWRESVGASGSDASHPDFNEYMAAYVWNDVNSKPARIDSTTERHVCEGLGIRPAQSAMLPMGSNIWSTQAHHE